MKWSEGGTKMKKFAEKMKEKKNDETDVGLSLCKSWKDAAKSKNLET